MTMMVKKIEIVIWAELDVVGLFLFYVVSF